MDMWNKIKNVCNSTTGSKLNDKETTVDVRRNITTYRRKRKHAKTKIKTTEKSMK